MPARSRRRLRALVVERHQRFQIVRLAAAGDTPRRRGRVTIFSAHGRASSGDVGRQVKIRRRLGVSDTPVGLNGPVTTKSRRCGSVREAVLRADLRVGDAVRRSARCCRSPAPRTCGRTPPRRAAARRARASASVCSSTPFGIGLRHPAVDVEQRRRARRRPRSRSARRTARPSRRAGPSESRAATREDVLAVGRERVHRPRRRRACRAARPRRAPTATPGAAPCTSRSRARVRIADREPADLARRVEVRVEQRRRRQSARRRCCRSWRSWCRAAGSRRRRRRAPSRSLDRPLVLGAVQALEGAAPGFGSSPPRLVEHLLERRRRATVERVAARARGARAAASSRRAAWRSSSRRSPAQRAAAATSNSSSDMSPAITVGLWHSEQKPRTTAVSVSTGIAGGTRAAWS